MTGFVGDVTTKYVFTNKQVIKISFSNRFINFCYDLTANRPLLHFYIVKYLIANMVCIKMFDIGNKITSAFPQALAIILLNYSLLKFCK